MIVWEMNIYDVVLLEESVEDIGGNSAIQAPDMEAVLVKTLHFVGNPFLKLAEFN